MKKRNIEKQSGFITLFFILGISFTFLTWISLSSERVFEYINIKNEFIKNRLYLYNHTLCADAFMNNLIKSKYNLDFVNNEYIFYRGLYFNDEYICHIKNINIVLVNNSISTIFFISEGFGFEYKLKNGFVNFGKSFNLF